MSTVRFGDSVTFVAFTLPASFLKDGWGTVDVEISLEAFQGRISPWFDADDLARFARELRLLHSRLDGRAALEPREGQFCLTLSGNGLGRIEAHGVAWSRATFGSRLDFEFVIDQTFLQEPIDALDLALRSLGRDDPAATGCPS